MTGCRDRPLRRFEPRTCRIEHEREVMELFLGTGRSKSENLVPSRKLGTKKGSEL